MHADEAAGLTECADCDAVVEVESDRAFAFGEWVLCFECALRRGGIFSEEQERWVSPPELSGLPRPEGGSGP